MAIDILLIAVYLSFASAVARAFTAQQARRTREDAASRMSVLKLKSRREFLRTAASGVAVMVMPYPSWGDFAPHRGRTAAAQSAGGNGWMGAPGKARYRIDGIPKVTGAKIYARDFRARDLPGWPEKEVYALVLRVVHADRLFCGVNLQLLPPELQPFRTVTQADLLRDKVGDVWTDEPGSLLVAPGEQPTLLGQPAAILLFQTAQQYRDAARLLQFRSDALCYGATVPPPLPQPFAEPLYLTRYGDEFSQTKSGPSNPTKPGGVNEQARLYRQKIRQRMQAPGLRVFEGIYETQVVDCMFMEPEAGLAWYDAAEETLSLLLGTQSTNGDVASAGSQSGALFYESGFKVSTVRLHPCYPGGGFGGRDVSPFMSLLAVAGVYAGGQPVRLAHDRFEQFQSGIKRNASVSQVRIAVDPTGQMQGLESQCTLYGGGKQNYSPFISDLAAFSAGNSYRFPVSAVESEALSSIGVTAGSMRGFGGPQAFFAMESLVDEAAAALGTDPIQFRLQNVLKDNDQTVTGYPLAGAVRLEEICKLAAQHTLWTGRQGEQAKRAGSDLLYGVGFALSMQAYGTGVDAVMAGVEIDNLGTVSVTTNCVDMGNGSATSLALSTAAALGTNAAKVNMGEVEAFNRALPLETGGDNQWDNPLWTASWAMSSSASLTAFQQVHAVQQAALILFVTGVWPTARALWGIGPSHPLAPEDTQWVDGKLVAPGLEPLALGDLAARAHRDGGVAATMVHAVYQSMWISAEYTVGNTTGRWPIDALATRSTPTSPVITAVTQLRLRGQPPVALRRARGMLGDYDFHPRRNTQPPPPSSVNYGRSLYAPSGTLVAVEVHRLTGQTKVLAVETFLDAGRVIQPDLLSGQFEGGVAMGIGYALLEELPLELGGAGDGTWNLNRYRMALGGDIPLDYVNLNLLPAAGPNPKGKGIAETVLCPMAPAIANAIAAATGQRFRSLPITPQKIRQRLGA